MIENKQKLKPIRIYESDVIEDQRNHGRLSEPLIPSEVKDTNQVVSEANEQDQVVLCMYVRLWKRYKETVAWR